VTVDADLLVHVVDAAAADPEAQFEAVRAILAEIGSADVSELVVVNKSDIAPNSAQRLLGRLEGSVAVSAETGEGIEHMLAVIGDRLRSRIPVVDLMIPWDRGDLIAALHRSGEVLSEASLEHGMRFRARLADADSGPFTGYMTDGSNERRGRDAS